MMNDNFIHIKFSELFKDNIDFPIEFNKFYLVFHSIDKKGDITFLDFKDRIDTIEKIKKFISSSFESSIEGVSIVSEIDLILIQVNESYLEFTNVLFSLANNTKDFTIIEELYLYNRILQNNSHFNFPHYYIRSIVNFLNNEKKSCISNIQYAKNQLSDREKSIEIVLNNLQNLLNKSNPNSINKIKILIIYSCCDESDFIEYNSFFRMIQLVNNFLKFDIKLIISNGKSDTYIAELLNEYRGSIIFCIGHGNEQKGFFVNLNMNCNKPRNGLFINLEFLYNFAYQYDGSSKYQLFFLFCCHGSSIFKNNDKVNCNFNFGHTLNAISFQHADPFILGFLYAIANSCSIEEAFILGKFSLSARSREFDEISLKII